jgi:hypothetical protein
MTVVRVKMQSNRGKDDSERHAHPSWIMAKFWAAVVIGAVVYGIEKSFDWCKRRLHYSNCG